MDGDEIKKLLPFTKLSTYSNTYETDTPEPLSCLSHPLQVSVDPDVCIITNNLFANGLDNGNYSDANLTGTYATFTAGSPVMLLFGMHTGFQLLE